MHRCFAVVNIAYDFSTEPRKDMGASACQTLWISGSGGERKKKTFYFTFQIVTQFRRPRLQIFCF